MKRILILGSVVVIVLQVVLVASPARAQEPIEGAAALAGTLTSLDVTVSLPKGRIYVGDRVTVQGTVLGGFLGAGLASGQADAAFAGALGDLSWQAGLTNPSGDTVAQVGTDHVAAGIAAALAFRSGIIEDGTSDGPSEHPAHNLETDMLNDSRSTAYSLALSSGDSMDASMDWDMGSDSLAATVAVAVSKEDTAAFAGGLATADEGAVALAAAGGVAGEERMTSGAAVTGLGAQDFSFDFKVDSAGEWVVSADARNVALAVAALLGRDRDPEVAFALALERLSYLLSFWVHNHGNWKPVAEHIVFTNLPADSRWGDLRRLELNGAWTDVPPLQPADSLPSPVHADLMIHGYGQCTYALRICSASGACQAPRYFTVKWTGSEGVQIYDYPNLAASSPVTAQPSF